MNPRCAATAAVGRSSSTAPPAAWLHDEDGNAYLDFFAGAGALNYGHNNPVLKQAVIDYLQRDGVTHALDMQTVAKRDFLETFTDVVIKPRELDYKIMFPGPAGANAVEAALKLARKVTGRESIINFTNAFHGMTLGALSVTGNSMKRGGAGIPLVHATPMPYDNYLDGQVADFLWFERLLDDPGSGLNQPAAVIVETVQGEGGINVARDEWLRGLAELCKRHDMLLIVDDVQMGCGRTGPFFSFESAGITPDIVCLSKSIGALRAAAGAHAAPPELDVWEPGEHNGTFRGISPAFVAATEAMRTYWTDDKLEKSTLAKGEQVGRVMTELAEQLPRHADAREGPRPRARARVRDRRPGGQGVPRRVRARAADGDLRPGRRGREGHAAAHDHRRRARQGPRPVVRRRARGVRVGEETR